MSFNWPRLRVVSTVLLMEGSIPLTVVLLRVPRSERSIAANRSSRLRSRDAPAADDAAGDAVRKPLLADAEGQFVDSVGFEGVRDIERSAGLLEFCVVDIEERFDAGLAVTGGIAEGLGEGVIELSLQPVAEAAGGIELQTVVGGVAVISEVIGRQDLVVLEERNSPGLAGGGVVGGKRTDLALKDEGAVGGVREGSLSTSLSKTGKGWLPARVGS